MNLKNMTIAFLGDSITEGIGTSSPDKVYHSILKERCGLKEALNYGISGTRIAAQTVSIEFYSEWDNDFMSRVDDLSVDADCIVVFGGTNDYEHGDADFGCFSDRHDKSFYGALHILMQKLINRYPDKTIVFMTPLHRTNDLHPQLVSHPKEHDLGEYVAAIKEVAAYYSVPVLDLYSVSGMNPCVEVQNKLFFADGIHPNDKGHMRIADRLESFLKSL